MPKEEIYIQFIVKCNEIWDADMIVAQLSPIGVEAFEEQEGVVIAGGKAPEMEIAEIEEWLIQQQLEFEKKEVANQNWNAQWEASFEPVVVDDFAGVRASFHAPMVGIKHEIVITPKMSFGTGHHATTWLMMQQMQHIDFAGKTVIDFGTGTGILGILAEKLGAAEVVGIDYDAWCMENAAENLEANGCTKMVVFQNDKVAGYQPAQIMLANINKHVILGQMDAMKDTTLPQGLWLLSGLLVEDEADIKNAAEEKGLVFHHTVQRNGWISMLFSKP